MACIIACRTRAKNPLGIWLGGVCMSDVFLHESLLIVAQGDQYCASSLFSWRCIKIVYIIWHLFAQWNVRISGLKSCMTSIGYLISRLHQSQLLFQIISGSTFADNLIAHHAIPWVPKADSARCKKKVGSDADNVLWSTKMRQVSLLPLSFDTFCWINSQGLLIWKQSLGPGGSRNAHGTKGTGGWH